MTTFREHNALATFEDIDRARESILALEREGLEGSDVSLLSRHDGPEGPDESADTREEDRQLGGDVGKRVATGAAVGTAAGGLAGFLVGLAAFSIPGVGPVIGAGVWASLVGGAVGGGAVGGIVAGVSGIGTSEAWQTTYAALEENRVVVGYHDDDPEGVERAEKVLREQEPLSVERFDARGARVSS